MTSIINLHRGVLLHAVAALALSALVVVETTASEKKPLQVFVLAGQSNMQGHAQVRTLAHLAMDKKTAPMLAELQDAEGKPKVCDRVWISSIGCAEEEQTGKLTAGFGAAAGGPKIGPEFSFGVYMEKFVDGPILLIKTSWGGKSLNTDFRSPSSGPYVFNETQLANFERQGKDVSPITADKAAATGHYYHLMIEHVKLVLSDIKRVIPDYDPAQGYQLAGFVWFQGWNDMVDSGTYPNRDQPGGYDAYSEAMGHFIRDVREDLDTPNLPFVIGVLGVGGPVEEYGPDQQRYKSTHQNFRLAMAAPAKLPEFRGNVTAVLTEKYWDRELTALRAKENAIRREVKKLVANGTIQPAQERATYEKKRMEDLSDYERKVLDTGVSNAEYHYLGSAKILVGIGKGFADAMAALME
ncbi:MAG: hypothetical protein H6822_03540 [Planctomycetaceae bacterium]|nr:hypothetical protein [Planctomycetales bacterium]MCB9921228.1 hypothetical protein [Planctomycetaceae bacterium]